MTLCPRHVLFATSLPTLLPPPPVWPPLPLHSPASVSPSCPHPADRALDPSRVRPSPPSGVSLQSGSSGLWRPVGAAFPPSRLGCSPGPAPAGSLFGKHPRAGGTAPGAGRHPEPGAGTMTAQRHTQTQPAAPPQTRARTHTVLHNRSPRAVPGRCRAHLDSRQQARSRKQPQAPALGPRCPRHPDTQTRPQRLLGPAGKPRPLHLGRPHLATLAPAALLPLLLAPARPRGPAAAGWARPAAAPRCLVTGTPQGQGGVRAQTVTLRPLSLCPAPGSPALETPPLAAKLCPSRRSPAFTQETTPLIEPRPPSALGTLSPNFA